jgi:hypothetical protein
MPCPARDTPEFRNRCPRMIELPALEISGARRTWNNLPYNLTRSMRLAAACCGGADGRRG